MTSYKLLLIVYIYQWFGELKELRETIPSETLTRTYGTSSLHERWLRGKCLP